MDEYLQILEDNGIEALDFVIDKITESKYFDGFPIVSQVLGAIKAARVIPNYLYAKKTCAFLDGLKSDSMDCGTFSKAMSELNKNTKKFEDELLFLIEKAENTEKAKILGYFTRLFALRSIDYNDFGLYTHSINNIQVSFLRTLSNEYSNKDYLNKSPLYGILLSQGFSENGSGFGVSGTTIKAGVNFSDKLLIFGDYLNKYFNSIE